MEKKQILKKCSLTRPVIFLLFLFMTSTAYAQITVNLQNRPLREVLNPDSAIEKILSLHFTISNA